MHDLFEVLTDPQTATFQTPETRPFCDTAADAIARFHSLEKSYQKEQAKGAAADPATLAGISKAQILCIDIARECLKHLTEWIEKQTQETTGNAQLN